MGLIIRLAPIGVFGSVAYTTAKFGLDSLLQLGYLVFTLLCRLAFYLLSLFLGSIFKTHRTEYL